MNKLTTFWQIIQIIGSLRLVSPSLIRSLNPETYTFYCSYNEGQGYVLPLPPGLLALSTTPIAVKNVRICGDLGCEYFRRMAAIGGGGATGLYANTIGTMTIAMAAAPFTGGLSLAVVAGWNAVSNTAIWYLATKCLKGIENELKLKYEIEQLEQEINDLKNENREGLEITLEASRNWYQRLLGLLEGRLENLKRQLCQAAGCNQYPNCPHGQ